MSDFFAIMVARRTLAAIRKNIQQIKLAIKTATREERQQLTRELKTARQQERGAKKYV